HGVQIEGRNFLLPIDVGTGDEYEVRDESVDLEDALMSRLVRSRKREKLIILDACRDNPFRAPNQKNRALLARGFAQMGSEKGSLIVYSTNPGNVAEDGTGKNSVFTEYFVREIQKDGVEVGQALRTVTSAVVASTMGRQTPWYNSSLLGDYYFRPMDVKLEEERRRKEVQQQVEVALRSAREELKRDESGRIETAVAARLADRERERQERERQYNAQIAEFKVLLDRREKELEQARVQVATAAKTRDEKLAVLATAEAERRQLERNPPAPAEPARVAVPDRAREDAERARESSEAKKLADAERVARERQARETKEERERLIKQEALRAAATEKAERAERERQAKAAAEIARAEAAKSQQQERDRLLQAEARRKAAEQARREDSDRQAKAVADRIRALEETGRQSAEKERLAGEAAAARASAEKQQRDQAAEARDTAQKQQREQVAATGNRAEIARLADAKVKVAKEDAVKQVREAETTERLARIQEDVRRKATLELEMLNRKASLPPELASLNVTEPQKVAAANGEFAVRGVRLPADVAIRPAAAGTPPNCSAFAGAWGNGRWNGERTVEVWVETVEANCRVRAIYARGGQGLTGEAASYVRGTGQVNGDQLALEFGAVRIELARDGDQAQGRWLSGVNAASSRLERIASQPDRFEPLFASEAADFGAAPSRVISANQISDRVRLPLPKIVPGVDTLTTLQFEAFIKAHPEAVLVDAVVSASHMTLPGAYWMPEIGQPVIGALERGQIEGALRTATGGDRSRPIVVFERSSSHGWHSYHGVLRLLGMGYGNVYWYRGGLDAWHDALLPLARAEAWNKAR
ncbi:MAG: caspase family protein, partial [Betaproteobacteria bacterium]